MRASASGDFEGLTQRLPKATKLFCPPPLHALVSSIVRTLVEQCGCCIVLNRVLYLTMRKRHEKIFILSLALVLLKTIEFEDHFPHSPFCATKTRTRTPPIPSLPPTCEHSAASSWKDPPTKAQYSLVVILHCPRIPMQQGWPMISQIMCSAAWEVRLRPPERGRKRNAKIVCFYAVTSVSLILAK